MIEIDPLKLRRVRCDCGGNSVTAGTLYEPENEELRSAIVGVCVLLGMSAPAGAAVSIGFNVGVYPDLVPIPGYPVYYAPQLDSNFFFYDGLYWVYAQDNWYSSPWYNGPWDTAAPEIVPLFVLRVPVRYYRQPPAYFRTWNPDGSPRWGEHWGHDWEQHRNGWDDWDRAAAACARPLPEYQRRYSGDRYPRADQQLTLGNENYSYQPRDASARARPPYQQTPGQGAVPQRRQSPPGAPMPRPPQSRDPPPMHSPDKNEKASSNAAAADPKRDLQHDH